MKRRIAVALILVCAGRAAAAPGGADSSFSPVPGDIGRGLGDARSWFLAPLTLDGKGWLAGGAVLGATALVMTLDDGARSAAARNHSPAADGLARFGEQYGNPLYAAAGAAACYAGGLLTRSPGMRETGIELFESVGFAAVTTVLIKEVVGRSRPFTGEGRWRYHGPTFADEWHSLPSGHSTVAFAAGSVLAERAQSVPAAVLLYSAAAVTAWSRVYQDEHWLSDVVLGAAIGTASGLTVAHLHDADRAGAQADGSLTILPAPGGFTLRYRF